MELIHLSLNTRFDIDVLFMTNYIFSGRRYLIDSETLLVTDFINFNIKHVVLVTNYIYRVGCTYIYL
jgi:hypothetical protein